MFIFLGVNTRTKPYRLRMEYQPKIAKPKENIVLGFFKKFGWRFILIWIIASIACFVILLVQQIYDMMLRYAETMLN